MKKGIKFYNARELELVKGTEVNHDFPKHTHEKCCIGLVENGDLVLDVKGETYNLEKDDVYLINSREEHRITSTSRTGFSYIVICFSNKDINKKIFSKSVVQNKELSQKILNFCDDVIESKLLVKEKLDSLLESIESGVESDDDFEIVDEKINSAIDYININVQEKVCLKRIAENSYISKYHFLRLFENKVGLSPHRFHIQQKIKLSKKMIVKHNVLTNIGIDLGFTDQSHFIRTFKKYTGITPREYKKSYEELEI